MNKNEDREKLKEINERIPQLFEKVINEATIDKIPDLIEALAQIENETERDIYVDKIVEKFKVSKRAIQKDIKRCSQNKNIDAKRIITASFPGLVDIVSDSDGEVSFLIHGVELSIEKSFEIDNAIYIPPQKEEIPFTLPRGDLVVAYYKEYFKEENATIDRELFQDIYNYFKRFSYLKNSDFQIVTLCVFLTYISDHPEIHYLPMLLFYAVPERGKTRTGKAFIYIAYRGIHQVDLREANLFRYSQNLQATLFLDIMSLWKKAEKNNSEDILLLRHEKGATVSRVLYPERGAFKDMVHFSVYGPTIIATNEAVHKILDSRCLPTTMPNKPGEYEDPTTEKAQKLKERLTAWRAQIMLEHLPEVEHVSELNGRLWDISKPLLQVCKLVCPENFESLKNTLSEIAGQRIEDRKESIEGQILTALYELSPDVENVFEWTIKTSELLNKLNDSRSEAYKLTPQYLGRKLKAIGFNTKLIMGYSQIRLKKSEFNLLLMQYGIIENNDVPTPVKTLPNPTKPSNQGIPTVYGSRELVGSQGNPTETLLSQSLDNQASKGEVGSSREFTGTGKEKHLKTLEVVE